MCSRIYKVLGTQSENLIDKNEIFENGELYFGLHLWAIQ